MTDAPNPLEVTYELAASIRHVRNLPYAKREAFEQIMIKHAVRMSGTTGYNHQNPDTFKRVWNLYILVPNGRWDAFKKDIGELMK